jgi:hypothetical protein
MFNKCMSCLSGYLVASLCFLVFIISCSPERPEITKVPEQSEKRAFEQTSPGAVSEEAPLSPHEGETGAAKESEETPVNNPPVVDRARLELETVGTTDILKVNALGSDKDGDEVTLEFEWVKNGEPLGSGDTIQEFKRGDIVSVKITPFDGKSYGRVKTLTTEISNCPPKITEHREVTFDGKLYSCQIRAVDPDEDPLTYSLKSAPSGMTIDPSTGLIQWNVPPDFQGEASIIVSVTDGHGGETTQNLTFEISPESQK